MGQRTPQAKDVHKPPVWMVVSQSDTSLPASHPGGPTLALLYHVACCMDGTDAGAVTSGWMLQGLASLPNTQRTTLHLLV